MIKNLKKKKKINSNHIIIYSFNYLHASSQVSPQRRQTQNEGYHEAIITTHMAIRIPHCQNHSF